MAYTQVDDTCYASELMAAQAIASREIGKVVQVGTASYVTDATVGSLPAGGPVINYVFRNVSSTAVINKSMTFQAQPCVALQASDAVTIGWAIAAAWLGVYAVMFITRAFRDNHTDSTYGTS